MNWLVKPFSMAALAWLFFRYVFSAWIPAADADQYIAGCIILAAAPCTAMVFVWSYLSDGDPAYTLVQVSVNDLLMLILFAPIVRFLVSGASSLEVPCRVLLYAVAIFIVIPLTVGVVLRGWFIHRKGVEWFEQKLLPRFAPVSMSALLATLVLIFAFQADNITQKYLHVLLIAVPILIQVYFNSSMTYGLMRLFKVPYFMAADVSLNSSIWDFVFSPDYLNMVLSSLPVDKRDNVLTQLDQFQKLVGVDLKTDLLQLLDGEAAFVMLPQSQQRSEFSYSLPFQFAAVFDSSDAAKFTARLDKIFKGASALGDGLKCKA